MSEERCIHEMLIGSCTICLPKDRPSAFIAKYDGECERCAEPIQLGSWVRWNDEGTYVQHAWHR